MKEKLLVSLDGSIESLVTTWLLKKQGFQLRAVLFDINNDPQEKEKIQNKAQEYEKKLSIPVQVHEGHQEAFELVSSAVKEAIQKGFRSDVRTLFHQKFLFPKLLELKTQFQFDKIATGHRISLQFDPIRNQMRVMRYHTPAQDESRMLLGVSSENLNSMLFPLGFIPLSMIQKLASELNMVSEKIPMNLGLNQVQEIQNAMIYDLDGSYVGIQESKARFSVGDRIDQNVVIKVDPSQSELKVAVFEDRTLREIWFEDSNWFSGMDLGFSTRNCSLTWGDYTKLHKVNLMQYEGGGIKAFLEEPLQGEQANIFNGDVAVWIDQDEVLGGGRVVNCL